MATKNKIEGIVDDIANDATTQSDFSTIRSDLEKLKNDVITLTRNLQEEGMQQSKYYTQKARESLYDVQDRAAQGYQQAQEYGQRSVRALEQRVQERPTQSVLFAFAAGIVFSFLMGRR